MLYIAIARLRFFLRIFFILEIDLWPPERILHKFPFVSMENAENLPLQERSSSEIGLLRVTPSHAFYYRFWERFLKVIRYIYKKSQQYQFISHTLFIHRLLALSFAFLKLSFSNNMWHN